MSSRLNPVIQTLQRLVKSAGNWRLLRRQRQEQRSARTRPSRWRALGRWTLLCVAVTLLLSALFIVPWLQQLDAQIQQRMTASFSGAEQESPDTATQQPSHTERPQWKLPARVYARPLELYAGLNISPEQVIDELELAGFTASPARTPGHYALTDNSLSIVSRGFAFGDFQEPAAVINASWNEENDLIVSLDTQPLSDPGSDTRADESTATGIARLEPIIIGQIHPEQHEDRLLLTMADTPPEFAPMLVAVEDKRFFSHHGVSITGIVRAALVNITSGSRRQGASTLTQQLVKNLFLTREKTYRRKINEAAMAILMDWRYDKNTILETFMNEVFIAQDGDRAIHGFGLASQYFFGKPMRELDIASQALLIGMLKAPSSYHPIRHPERATTRRNLVLQLAHNANVISDDVFTDATSTPLNVEVSQQSHGIGPAFLDSVKRQLLEQYPLDQLQTGGLNIFTSLDPSIQLATEQSVTDTIKDLTERFGDTALPEGFLEAAAVVTHPTTGDILAMVGGASSRVGGFNRALDAKRPVGSLLKPAVYLAGLQFPERYTLSSWLDDSPLTVDLPDYGQEETQWTPLNYNREFAGPVLTVEALARSLNVASVRLGLDVGIPAIVDMLERLGINDNIQQNPSLILGASAFSVMDMATLYQTIASDGFQTPLRAIREVITQDGRTLNQFPLNLTQSVSPDTVYLMKHALTEAMLTGTGRGAYRTLDKGFFAAGKTGTSDDQRDSWFAGFTGDTLAVVWLGNDQNQSTPLTGSSVALALWTRLIDRVSNTPLAYDIPQNIEYHPIDIKTGKRIRGECESAMRLPYIAGSAPQATTRCPGTGVTHWFRSLFR